MSQDQHELTRLAAALNARDHEGIVAAIQQLIARSSKLDLRWISIARVAHKAGEFDLANAAMDLLIRERPDDTALQFERVVLLAQTNRIPEASLAMEKLPDTTPDRVQHYYLRGTLALNLGNFELAERQLRQALRHNEASGQAMLALSAIRDLSIDDGIARTIINAKPSLKDGPDLERACYQYALSKVLNDQGEHKDAFYELSVGSEILRAMRPYDKEKDRSHARSMASTYDSATITRLADLYRECEQDPIFVVGLPRSGTTLIQQILSSHTAVGNGAEISRLPVLMRNIGGSKPQNLASRAANFPGTPPGHSYIHLARQYLHHNLRIVDKSIENTRYLGLIKAILPQSRIIWIRRDFFDCAWSCYSNYFARGLDWSFDISDIGSHFSYERTILDHWQRELADQILVIDYEQLVSNPSNCIKKLLEYCNLSQEIGPYEHSREKRVIATSSVVQARSPISTSAIGKAGPYREFLIPAFDAYSEANND